jgi:hypothetical protein
MLPEAPMRLSTITGWPASSLTRCATIRVVRSAPPPGAKGEIQRSGFAGNCCADAQAQAVRHATAKLRTKKLHIIDLRRFCAVPP